MEAGGSSVLGFGSPVFPFSILDLFQLRHSRQHPGHSVIGNWTRNPWTSCPPVTTLSSTPLRGQFLQSLSTSSGLQLLSVPIPCQSGCQIQTLILPKPWASLNPYATRQLTNLSFCGCSHSPPPTFLLSWLLGCHPGHGSSCNSEMLLSLFPVHTIS